MTKISAPGVKDQDFSEEDIDLGLLEEAGKSKVKVDVLGRINIDVSRAGGDPAEIDGTKPDSVVEVKFEGGLEWITTVERLKGDFPDQPDRRAAAGEDDRFRLPTHIGPAALRGGGGDLRLTQTSLFDLDIDELIKELLGDPAAKAGEVAGRRIGPKLAEWFDKRQVKNPGLQRLTGTDDGIKLDLLDKELPLPGEQPYLLFLHGTASTTEGSFGGLWQDNPSFWRQIRERYDGRMLALEHHTLAQSPIANALDAVMMLPKNAKLHLVSHSRGGMVGELLCRSGRLSGSATDKLFDEIDYEKLDGESYQRLKADLMIFEDLLAKKEITVERFVRVACPAAGTTLADGKLDRWLSTLLNVVGYIGADVSSIYRFVKGFLLAVVQTRAEPEHIPGLEAMMPGSPLTKILNRPDIVTSADLSVIAGDIEGEGVFHRLGVWLTDRYYPGDHDLIVDTASMYGGLRRLPGRSRRYFEDGPKVYHFRYFKNRSSAGRVWDGLRYENRPSGEPPADVPGFLPIPASDQLEEMRSRSGEPRPTVFILPGILGSELRHDGKRIWMSVKQIFRGRLERLDLHRDHPKTFEAFQMFPRYYADLARYLAGSHNVEPFPYDWRLSMQEEAKKFAAALSKELKGNSQPVRVIAHSMGGLVARLAFALDPDLWRSFKAKDGCRLIMLGTPNRGSFSIARMLMGKEQTTGLLALLDTEHSEKELLNFIRRFPGVLELLPADSHHDFFDETVWKEMDRVDGKGWQEPVASDLGAARQTWRLLENAPVDSTRMIYVAGQAAATPIDMSIERNRVRFRATGLGDGRVPWETGIPKDMPTFYVKAEHGDLARHERSFGGYLDLLRQGTTRLLEDKQPTVRGSAIPFELPDDPTPLYPDQEALEAAALGARPRYAAPTEKARPITIQLHLGDLSFSRFPVMVGHYEQDSLNGTERHLDKALNQRLSARRQRGLYPGEINTAEVVLDDERFPPGAVVVGLGEVGGLTVGKLKRALLHGLRRYCLTLDEKKEHEGQEGESYGLSTLIIGSGVDALPTEDALAALLDAILDLQRADQLGGLTQLDIIELYEHRAIAAMRSLAKLYKQPRYEGHLDLKLELKEGTGGIRKIVLENPTDWAQRIQVKEMEVAGRYRGLQYAVLTGSARIEDIAVPDTLKLADAFIDAAIEQTRFDGHSSPGRTLFELLLPRRLKLLSDDDRDLVLMLDQFSAGYPWELMEDPRDDHVEPPAVRAGLIRQLHDKSFRPDVRITSQQTALVIGDPLPNRTDPRFPALDGAVEEARTVAGMIGRAGYAVTEEIRTSPAAAIATFMNEPYRIMHLAGHGVFEETLDDQPSQDATDDKSKKKCPTSGMVLGDGLFLTPGAVEQLTNVPELVFLNCCYLGRVDVSAERRTTTHFNQLAANLATQFIKIGARAVIAAGWAVDDAAANTFASTFYQAMLGDGDRFIDAVKLARRRTYMTHAYTNSWGAYQAYGDPDFTLNGKKAGGGDGTAKWYHPYEAVLAFDELSQWAQTAARTNPGDLRRTYEKHWQSTAAAWRIRSDVLAAKAKAAGELGLFQDAIEAYDQAIQAEKSEATIRAVEQRANLRARYAVHLAKGKAAPKELPSPQPLDMIIKSWRELEELQELQPTPDDTTTNLELLNLFGSAAKRASQLFVRSDKTAVDLQLEPAGPFASEEEEEAARRALSKTVARTYIVDNIDRTGLQDDQLRWLRRSAEWYKRAHTARKEKAYGVTNWLTVEVLITLRELVPAKKSEASSKDEKSFLPTLAEQRKLLSEAAQASEKADLDKPGFWDFAAKGDVALTSLLIDAAEKQKTEETKPKDKAKTKDTEAYQKRFAGWVDTESKKIAGHYLKAWERGGSILKMNSVLEQLGFIVDALSIGPTESKFERYCLRDAIRHIEEAISQKMSATG